MSHRGTFAVAPSRRATFLLLALLLPFAPPLAADGSSQRDPSATFSTPGLKTVTLTVCRSGSCSTTTQTLRVLDPAPVLSFAAVQPATVEVGQLVENFNDAGAYSVSLVLALIAVLVLVAMTVIKPREAH